MKPNFRCHQDQPHPRSRRPHAQASFGECEGRSLVFQHVNEELRTSKNDLWCLEMYVAPSLISLRSTAVAVGSKANARVR